MLTIGIRYLTRYVSAADLSRAQVEWPPHPGRVFMALTAAHFESGTSAEERAALEWLESAGAPAIQASGIDQRSDVRTYVPVNDNHGGITRRPRQDRSFQRGRPHQDCVYLQWPHDPPPQLRNALERLCAKVTRIGHSASSVQAWVLPECDGLDPNWVPDEFGDSRLRVPSNGTLRYLEGAFNGAAVAEYDALAGAVAEAKGKQKVRLKQELAEQFPAGRPESSRPTLTNWQGYGQRAVQPETAPVIDGPFDENILVLAKNDGPSLGLESTLQLTAALRNALMKALDPEVPEWISGHAADGTVTRHSHVAFFPLPYAGHAHADGHILGLAMAFPRSIHGLDSAGRERELSRTIGRFLFDAATGQENEIHLYRGAAWEWTLSRETRERPPLALRTVNWTRPSMRWASVTPVVLHHYPKKRGGEVERIVREAFVSAGFPEPAHLALNSQSALEGAGHAREVPPFTEGGADLCRYQVHVLAEFAHPVRGPMLVGRGRFRGYGLFKPMEDSL